MTDTRDICQECGKLIPYAVEQVNVGPFQMESRQERCEECNYLRNFNRHHLRQPMWQVPIPRPTKDGQVPKVIRDCIAKRRAKQAERRETTR